MVKKRHLKMHKLRTTLTIQGEDAELLNELQIRFKEKYNLTLPLIEIVRKALRELNKIEQ